MIRIKLSSNPRPERVRQLYSGFYYAPLSAYQSRAVSSCEVGLIAASLLYYPVYRRKNEIGHLTGFGCRSSMGLLFYPRPYLDFEGLKDEYSRFDGVDSCPCGRRIMAAMGSNKLLSLVEVPNVTTRPVKLKNAAHIDLRCSGGLN